MASEVWAHKVERPNGIATRAHMTEGNTVVVFERGKTKPVDRYPYPGRMISCEDDLSLGPSYYSRARDMAYGILGEKRKKAQAS